MEGTYTQKDDNRIILRPPSHVGIQTDLDSNGGLDNPGVDLEAETNLESGGGTHARENGDANGNTVPIYGVKYGEETVHTIQDDIDFDDDDPKCGWFRCRPDCLQVCFDFFFGIYDSMHVSFPHYTFAREVNQSIF